MPSQIDLVQRQLAISNAELTAASKNIANVNTPNYKAIAVEPFAASITESERGTTYSFKHQEGLTSRTDGNNVNIDQEIGQLKKSSLKQRAFTELLSTKIRQMKLAMSSNS